MTTEIEKEMLSVLKNVFLNTECECNKILDQGAICNHCLISNFFEHYTKNINKTLQIPITEQEYKKFLIIREKVMEQCKKILSEIHKMVPVDGFTYLEMKYFDEDWVYFEGEENYEIEIPVECLFDQKTKEDFLEVIKQSAIKEKEKLTRLHKMLERDREKKDREEYLRLKEKFESDN